ncbi:MAG: GxxExxY protein [Ignavibacteria bacterium]
MAELLYKDLTEKIIKSFLEVYNLLGYGYSRDVYLEALYVEMRNHGLVFEREVLKDVFYKSNKVGQYKFDFVNEDKVLVRVETVERVNAANEFILVNQLKATNYEIGLLLNFGKRPEVKRKIFQNARKVFKKEL